MREGNDNHSFIDDDEIGLYKSTVVSNFSGDGIIVDAGCFVGSSTLAICEALSVLNVAEEVKIGKVVVIDRFVANDQYILEYFSGRCINLRYGESFLPMFMRNIQNFVPYLEIRAGDLLQVGRIETPIDILAVDIAKSPSLNAYIILNWFKNLVPGRSVVIHQDFYTPSQPWIAVSMGVLLDYFTIECQKAGESASFSLKNAIPDAILRKAVATMPRTADGLKALDRIIGILPEMESAPLKLSKAITLSYMGRKSDAESLLEEMLSLRTRPADKKWEKWLSIALTIISPQIFDREKLLSDVYMNYGAMRLGE
jgi:hypothetical protein